MKTCSKCLSTLDLCHFGKNSGRRDGYADRCKACRKSDQRVYIKTRTGLVKRKEAQARYRTSINGKLRCKAQASAHRALADGSIESQDHCTDCGCTNKALHMHHEDYAKPLIVIFLCPACHVIRHQVIK